MAQLLGNVAVGTVLKLNENGTPQKYIVVHQGKPSSMYDDSCNGTWLLRQDIWNTRAWSPNGENYFGGLLSINTLLDDDYITKFSKDIRGVVKRVKIPYCVGYTSGEVYTGADGYKCQMFLLSGYEKRIAKLSGSVKWWWLRSAITNSRSNVWSVTSEGGGSKASADISEYGVRPAMVMPQGLVVDDSNNITSTQFPWPLPSVSTLTAPSLAMQQQTIPLSWTPVSISGFDITYQLQRNADNGGWTTIYTGTDTSYTDTAGAWNQVQYQVAAVIEGFTGDYTQSSTIPVSNPSALVISGSDGNLGTLTSNVPYTVSSNTGNPISLTRTVNGAQVVTLTVESGFAYNIPIADLPTGTGTIQITASVKNGSETVTKTRTWTYYKTPINISSTGGIAQLTQNGQNIWPITVPDAVEAPVYLGGNLNAALNKLGQASLYTKIGSPKYNQVTVDLSKVSVGDEVLLPYNDVMVPHIVVHIGNPDPSMYDASCDGVWLLRKDAPERGGWNPNGTNTLDGSTIITTMAGYASNYNSEVQNAIKTIKIPYCVGGGSSTVNSLANGLSCKLFPLSSIELGYTPNTMLGTFDMPVDGVNFSYFSSDSERNLSNQSYWTRTPFTNNNNYAFNITESGGIGNSGHVNNARMGYNYCFIMPTTFNQTYYVDSSNNIHPAQEYTQGGSITDVFGYDVPICQYETGSYTGTGTYGSGNANSITFSFSPKFVFINDATNYNQGVGVYRLTGLFVKGNRYYSNFGTKSIAGGNAYSSANCEFAIDGNILRWYSPSDNNYQLNVQGHKYTYIAIG